MQANHLVLWKSEKNIDPLLVGRGPNLLPLPKNTTSAVVFGLDLYPFRPQGAAFRALPVDTAPMTALGIIRF